MKCAEKRRRQKQNNCEYTTELERQKKRRSKQRKSKRESRQKYNQKNRDETLTCPMCHYDIKQYKKAEHEQSKGHQFLAEQISKWN